MACAVGAPCAVRGSRGGAFLELACFAVEPLVALALPRGAVAPPLGRALRGPVRCVVRPGLIEPGRRLGALGRGAVPKPALEAAALVLGVVPAAVAVAKALDHVGPPPGHPIPKVHRQASRAGVPQDHVELLEDLHLAPGPEAGPGVDRVHAAAHDLGLGVGPVQVQGVHFGAGGHAHVRLALAVVDYEADGLLKLVPARDCGAPDGPAIPPLKSEEWPIVGFGDVAVLVL
mmetsp:Transcript_65219/g.147097  ORF Transcript_65219/g.147097 Transcript_65219/m.147097 type:complete len:231 (-) Transcript_65219:26-718(-)